MRTPEQRLVDRYKKRSSKRSIWRQLVRTMACIVVFCTTYALILPAITTEKTYHCGSEEHTHHERCYTQVLQTRYTCGSETHSHDSGCIQTDTLLELSCPLTEHTHGERCRSDPNADLETPEMWEKTLPKEGLTGAWEDDLLHTAQSQIGYRESDENYMWEEGQSRKGYTRYGAWFGVPYGSWNAMFVSFCLHYAGIPGEAVPAGANVTAWQETLKSLDWYSTQGMPRVGDPVFYREDPQGELRVGITAVTEASYDESGQPTILRLEIIEGDSSDEVVQRRLDPENLTLEGWLSMDKAQRTIKPGDSRQEVVSEIQPMAQTASVNLNFYSWSQWNAISFPNGNSYTCEVGSTVTIVLGDSSCNYSKPSLTLSGCTLVSQSFTCGTAGCDHSNWCSNNPTHTFVVKITEPSASVEAQVKGASWSNNSVTITPPSSGGETQPSQPSETTLPRETTQPTETTKPEETTKPTQPSQPPETTAPTEPVIPDYPYHPKAAETGDIDITRLRFYNICENGDNGVSALAGCVFEIRGDNGYSTTITSGDSVEVNLPADIPDGTYTITEVSAPAGYMRDEQYQRTFTVQGGALVSDKNIGTFINHSLGQLTAGKSGEVADYNNRIYRILLNAESHMRMYEMDPVDVLFVVDQSNSMLFPAGLNETGKQVTLNLSGQGNVANLEALNLDKTQHYYIISDPQGTSTVWSLWYNGQGWIYQDASYYAKAYYKNATGYQDPNETAIFPENRSYSDQKAAEATGTRSNGGGIGFNLSGSGLGNYLSNNGNTQTFKIYTATDEYNRLHYLEQSLENMIYELADINAENRVTLVRFTKEVKSSDCMGPLKLTPDNADKLVDAVSHINTSGGTRQDIALRYTYDNYLNNAGQDYSDDPNYNYTILITDGAPVLSGGSELKNLGSPKDPPSTTADSVYAQIQGYAALVREKSQLMTVGLGMESVEAGKEVLEKIASNEDYSCALNDAAELTKKIQELLLNGMRPKEAVALYGDITDEISDSFYPIAYTAPGGGAATGRQVLVQDSGRDWILLQEGDWITVDGAYTTAGAPDAAGQLHRREDGTFFFRWTDQKLYDSYLDQTQRIAWMPQGKGAGSGRTFIGTYGGRDWVVLNAGDYISQEGEYYVGTPSYWNRRYYGQIAVNNGVYSVNWGSSANGNNRQYYPGGQRWEGTFYVKAKEDFIGGNAIDTNKDAYVTVEGAEKHLDTPTVNVRLLGINEFQSEVTVYLGDRINEEENAPIDSLLGFYEDLRFTKLIADGTDVLNAVTAGSDPADGLEEAVFYLRYALGRELTADEWSRLKNGEAITVPYTYDDPSSHGPVGEFTFRLEKTGMAGANPDYDVHEATAACQPGGLPLTEDCAAPAETYKLLVTYKAYALGESGRPSGNVNNGSGSPGTEVGTGSTLETGLGTLESENIHEVHVISGSIRISKRIEADLMSDQPQTFTFTIHRTEDGEDRSKDQSLTITVPAGSQTGSASITFSGLRRGTYTVTEAAGEHHTVKSITVLESTNCLSDPAIGISDTEVTFVMGTNPSGNDVIGRRNPEDPYTQYRNPPNGVFGEAVFTNGKVVYTDEIPVVKVWDDGEAEHPGDAVYVVLILDGVPVLDGDGNARLLRLDAENGWSGVFTVPLTGPGDSLANYAYAVREVTNLSASSVPGWTPAILENDGTTAVFYERALDNGGQLSLSSRGYLVEYAVDENGLWTVTNHRTVDLPMTGSIGTAPFHTFGLLLILAAALMYIRIPGRNRRKEGS